MKRTKCQIANTLKIHEQRDVDMFVLVRFECVISPAVLFDKTLHSYIFVYHISVRLQQTIGLALCVSGSRCICVYACIGMNVP